MNNTVVLTLVMARNSNVHPEKVCVKTAGKKIILKLTTFLALLFRFSTSNYLCKRLITIGVHYTFPTSGREEHIKWGTLNYFNCQGGLWSKKKKKKGQDLLVYITSCRRLLKCVSYSFSY